MLDYKINLKHLVYPLLIATMGLGSCVDNKYDLNKVDTDDIVIGDELAVPLGTAKITTKDLLDTENVPEIKIDAQGNYLVSYKGDFKIDMPTDIGINDTDIDLTEISIPNLIAGTNTLPEEFSAQLPTKEDKIEFEATGNVTRLDSIIFDQVTPIEKPSFTMSVELKGLNINSGSGMFKLHIKLPKELEISAKKLPNGTIFSNNTLSYNMPLGTSTNIVTFDFFIYKALMASSPMIEYSADFTIARNSNITVSTTPKIVIIGKLQNADYKAIYGEFDVDLKADDQQIALDGLNNIFQGNDNILSFTDPRLKIETNSNVGIPLAAKMTLKAKNLANGKNAQTTIENIEINAAQKLGTTATTKLWIGAKAPEAGSGYTFVQNSTLSDIIKIAPDNIDLSLATNSVLSPNMFFPATPSATASYTVELPLAAAPDFRATITQYIDNVFDEDLIKYLFSNGEVVIKATVSNDIPLDFKMELVITDDQKQPVGIVIAPQNVKSATTSTTISNVSFPITNKDMPKMKNAKNIAINLVATGSNGANLRENQQITLELKINRKGGINLN